MSSEPEYMACGACGATIYPEHIQAGAAQRFSGRLLCPHCVTAAHQPAARQPAPATPIIAAKAVNVLGDGKSALSRPLDPASPFATRCKTFHTKLADASIVYMDQQINEWLDGKQDVRVKFATTTVGVVEGKHNDAHLIVTLFY